LEYDNSKNLYSTYRSQQLAPLAARGLPNAEDYIPDISSVGATDPKLEVNNFVSSPEAKNTISPDLNNKISTLTGGKTFNTGGELAIYMSGLAGATPQAVLDTLKSLGIMQ